MSATPDLVGDRYEIVVELGRGGMGTTYAAIDRQTGARVALKRLDMRRLDDWKSLELFERESRVLAALEHPGIPAYRDYFGGGDDDSTFTLVQDLAPGRTLSTWVSDGWRPSETDVRDLAERVLEIFVYLQERNPPVIHRDLKPENILRDDDGSIYVVDFGSVRDTVQHTISGGSTVVGTFGYMAPEQFTGRADQRTDLFGLGATLIYTLTGTAPSELPQIRMQIDYRARCSIGDPFAAWLDRMIAPASEDRFSGAKEALDALRAGPTVGLSAPPRRQRFVPAPAHPSGSSFPPATASRSAALVALPQPEEQIPIIGGPRRLELAYDIDREISDDEVDELITIFQEATELSGQMGGVGKRITWTAHATSQNQRFITASIQRRRGKTKIRLKESLGQLAGGLYGGLGGGIGGGVGGGMSYPAYAVGGVIGVIVWIIFCVIGSLALARAIFNRTVKKRRRQYDEIDREVRGLLATQPLPPSVSQPAYAAVDDAIVDDELAEIEELDSVAYDDD